MSVIIFEKEEDLGFVTINRPEVKNALNSEVFFGLKKILTEIKEDERIKVVLFKGAGDTFISGADVRELRRLDPILGWFNSRFNQSIFTEIERLGKPTIAVIDGAALGGGLELALACTIRLASERARLGLPEISLGILPAFGGTQRLIRLVGYGKAQELILTAQILDAEEALKIGLVNRVVPHERLLDEAKAIAKKIASFNPFTVRLAMELLNLSKDAPLEAGLAMEASSAPLTLASELTKELLEKFLERSRR